MKAQNEKVQYKRNFIILVTTISLIIILLLGYKNYRSKEYTTSEPYPIEHVINIGVLTPNTCGMSNRMLTRYVNGYYLELVANEFLGDFIYEPTYKTYLALEVLEYRFKHSENIESVLKTMEENGLYRDTNYDIDWIIHNPIKAFKLNEIIRVSLESEGSKIYYEQMLQEGTQILTEEEFNEQYNTEHYTTEHYTTQLNYSPVYDKKDREAVFIYVYNFLLHDLEELNFNNNNTLEIGIYDQIAEDQERFDEIGISIENRLTKEWYVGNQEKIDRLIEETSFGKTLEYMMFLYDNPSKIKAFEERIDSFENTYETSQSSELLEFYQNDKERLENYILEFCNQSEYGLLTLEEEQIEKLRKRYKLEENGYQESWRESLEILKHKNGKIGLYYILENTNDGVEETIIKSISGLYTLGILDNEYENLPENIKIDEGWYMFFRECNE